MRAGWINTLLQESENARQHLVMFLQVGRTTHQSAVAVYVDWQLIGRGAEGQSVRGRLVLV